MTEVVIKVIENIEVIKKTPADYRFLVKSDPVKYQLHLDYQREYRKNHRPTPSKKEKVVKVFNKDNLCQNCQCQLESIKNIV
jgi:hypothetical protein